jgi:ABC-2 type transport system permease protein
LLVVVVRMLGGRTPVESLSGWMQWLTDHLPSRHFVSFSHVIISRGRVDAVCSQFLRAGSIERASLCSVSRFSASQPP